MGRNPFKEPEAEAIAKTTEGGAYKDLKDFLRRKINTGTTKNELARFFNVSRHTITEWMEKRDLVLTTRARCK